MSRSRPSGVGLVFLGTSDFAVPSLEALAGAGETVRLVITQPDRPKGRGQRLEPPPVKRAADRLGLPTFQPLSVNAPEAAEELARLAPEFLVVAAFGQILRKPVLELPTLGCVNLHPSLLPRHRGPSPVAWTILVGDDRAGVTTMLMDEGLDSGPILLQEAFSLSSEATRGELEAQLAEAGGLLLTQTLRGLREGKLKARPQDPALATQSRILTREMRRLDWGQEAALVRRAVHALAPAPGAVARARGRLLKILRVREVERRGPEGCIVELLPEGPVVACRKGALLLLEVQPEGKRPMSGAEYARGGGVGPGTPLEAPWDE